MHYVSLIIEFLRGRPRVVFWFVALSQAALWTFIPALFYSAPPGGAPLLLAIGHEFVLGSYLGPPLAFWLGEVAFRIAGAFGLLRAGASLHRRRPIGRYSRSDARSSACAMPCWRSADGRRCRLHGAEPGFRRSHHGGAALGAGASALLARGGRGQARLLVPAGARSRPAAAGELCRADPDRADDPVHARHRARARRAHAAGAVDRGAAARHRRVSACPLAVEQPRAGARGLQRRPGAGRRPCALAVASAAAPVGASRAGAADRAGERLAAPAARARRPRSTAARPSDWRAGTSMCSRWRRRSSPSPSWPAATGSGRSTRVAPLVVLSGLAVVVLAGDQVLLYRERLVSSAWLGLLVLPPADGGVRASPSCPGSAAPT